MGEESLYWPYVDLLFDANEPPDLDAWRSLPGAAGRRARALAELREQELAELCTALPGASRRRAAQALHAVNSRALYSKSAGVRALVPIFDFMNHAARPNAVWSMDVDDLSVSISAARPIAAGEEITISYDEVPNAKLLLMYGFVMGGEGLHRGVDLLVCLGSDIVPTIPAGPRKPPAPPVQGCSDGAGSCGTSAEVRVLGSGVLARRSALAPLLSVMACGGEVPLARALAGAAAAERTEWLSLEATTCDPRLETLGRLSAEVLGRFLDRVEAWLAAPQKGGPLMAALGRPTVAEEAPAGACTDSDSTCGADSNSELEVDGS